MKFSYNCNVQKTEAMKFSYNCNVQNTDTIKFCYNGNVRKTDTIKFSYNCNAQRLAKNWTVQWIRISCLTGLSNTGDLDIFYLLSKEINV
jgi:hypothetical protein